MNEYHPMTHIVDLALRLEHRFLRAVNSEAYTMRN